MTSFRSRRPTYDREMPAASATTCWVRPRAMRMDRRSAARSATARRTARRPRSPGCSRAGMCPMIIRATCRALTAGRRVGLAEAAPHDGRHPSGTGATREGTSARAFDIWGGRRPFRADRGRDSGRFRACRWRDREGRCGMPLGGARRLSGEAPRVARRVAACRSRDAARTGPTCRATRRGRTSPPWAGARSPRCAARSSGRRARPRPPGSGPRGPRPTRRRASAS